MITPSEVTRSIASAIIVPISLLPLEMVATWAMSSRPASGRLWRSRSANTNLVAFSIPRLSPIGEAPAVRLRTPSSTMASASRAAVVVPSPAVSLARRAASARSCAPMFSKWSGSSMSRTMVAPSLVIWGLPYLRSITTDRPRGPSVGRTAAATWAVPRSRASRAWSSNFSCLAGTYSTLLGLGRGSRRPSSWVPRALGSSIQDLPLDATTARMSRSDRIR